MNWVDAECRSDRFVATLWKAADRRELAMAIVPVVGTIADGST